VEIKAQIIQLADFGPIRKVARKAVDLVNNQAISFTFLQRSEHQAKQRSPLSGSGFFFLKPLTDLDLALRAIKHGRFFLRDRRYTFTLFGGGYAYVSKTCFHIIFELSKTELSGDEAVHHYSDLITTIDKIHFAHMVLMDISSLYTGLDNRFKYTVFKN